MDKQPVGQLPDLTQSNNDNEIMVITDSEHNQLKKEKISDFITDLTSTDENNAIVKGTDGKLFTKDFGNASNITEGTLPVDVLPESGVTADTYAYPSSVTVNAQGMVTAIEEGSPSGSNANTDLSNITEAGKEVILENSAGQPIGSLFWSFATADYVPEYALACDGTEYAASLFPGLWNDYLTAETPKLQTCTYEEYQQEITQYGACAKFAVDTALNKFKVPTIKNTIYQGLSGTVPVVGNGKSLGLTDGTNNAGLFWSSGTNSGHTLSSKNSYGVDIATSSTWNSANLGSNKVVGVTSDATKSGLVAQLSSGDTSGITLKCFVVVANTSDNETAFDWSQWASSLTDKLNTDHSNDTKPYITETYQNGNSWYRIWSDGWIEQGNTYWKNSSCEGLNTINFIKPFSNTNYTFSTNCLHIDSGLGYGGIAEIYPSRTTSQTKIRQTSALFGYTWRACGY